MFIMLSVDIDLERTETSDVALVELTLIAYPFYTSNFMIVSAYSRRIIISIVWVALLECVCLIVFIVIAVVACFFLWIGCN